MEKQYSKNQLLDFGRLCSNNPQLGVNHLFDKWCMPEFVTNVKVETNIPKFYIQSTTDNLYYQGMAINKEIK